MKKLADLSNLEVEQFLRSHPEYQINVYTIGFKTRDHEEFNELRLSQGPGIYETEENDIVFWNGFTAVSGCIQDKKGRYVDMKRKVIFLTDEGHKAIKEYVLEKRLEGS